MINVFIIEKPRLKAAYLPFLYPNWGFVENRTTPFLNRAAMELKEPVFNIVPKIEDADFLLPPYDYFALKEHFPGYLDDFIKLSLKTGKKILLFDLSDYSRKEIKIPNSIIFRLAVYGHLKKENEIIMPALVEDLSVGRELVLRRKKDAPVAGFCGYAGFKNFESKMRFLAKNFLIDLCAAFDERKRVFKQGLYFRRKALEALSRSKIVKTNFIARNFYSANLKTLEIPPEKARAEYIQNILNSDFTLCPKGDANYSARFYEVLSLGRIPVLIDTDCVLPLQDSLDYENFIVFADYKNIGKIDEIISDFYKNLDEDEFAKIQKRAREVFEKYLKIGHFFRIIESQLKKMV